MLALLLEALATLGAVDEAIAMVSACVPCVHMVLGLPAL